MTDLDFFISTRGEKNNFIVYESETFRLSEFDLLNLIKICYVNSRSKLIGRKLIKVYEDATEHRKELTEKRLKLIGINKNEKPTIKEFTKRK